MHWRIKAAIQNAIARLPDKISYELYYQVQRRSGSLRRIDPFPKMEAGRHVWSRLTNLECPPAGKTFFEVGTGRVPLLPMAFWLMGAERTITIDLNPYLREELVVQSVRTLLKDQARVRQTLGPFLVEDRLARLLALGSTPQLSTDAVLDLCGITYIAPGDATATGLPSSSIDFHTSYTVFEHIPLTHLRRIAAESRRLLRSDGLCIHRIDYSDHFAHSDQHITRVNFLQYSDAAWDRLAGNRYMYMNRLRHDDYLSLFQEAGHQLVAVEPTIDDLSQLALKGGDIALDARFQGKPLDILATTAAWITTRPG